MPNRYVLAILGLTLMLGLAGQSIAAEDGAAPAAASTESSTTEASFQASAPVAPEPSTEDKELCEKFLPYADFLKAAGERARFVRAEVTPLDDPKFAFEMLVPRNWVPSPISISDEQLKNDSHTQIALFAISPKVARPEVFTQVRYMRVPKDVTASQFLDVYARKLDAEIVCRQSAEVSGRKVEDALLKMKQAGLGEVNMRITITARGDSMFFVASTAPVRQYEQWKNDFAASAVSFKLPQSSK